MNWLSFAIGVGSLLLAEFLIGTGLFIFLLVRIYKRQKASAKHPLFNND